jgi:beta-lactam-binding protein with PASTA domain
MRRGVLGGWPVRAEMIEQSAVSDETAVTVEEAGPAPPPGPPMEPPPERDLWPWLLALLLLVLVGVVAVYFATRDDQGTRGKPKSPTTVRATMPPPPATTSRTASAAGRVTVPRLVGLTAVAAIRRLQRLGLTGTARNVFSSKQPNHVVAQAPEASRELAKGASVTLTVSKGPKTFPVPDVVGQAVADALSTLRARNLKTRVVRVPNPARAGQVVAQHPSAGASAQAFVLVRLNVADGKSAGIAPSTSAQAATPSTAGTPLAAPGLVPVPDLVGKKLADARESLRKVVLIIEVRRVPNQQPLGTIVAQARKPGTRIKRRSHLLVTVSMGRPGSAPSSASDSGSSGSASTAVSIPDVVGANETTAVQDLQTAGFTVRTVDRDASDPSQDGMVLAQSPAANSSAKPDSTVTIYVGRYTSG